jgi:aminoglycoside phosphotransferase (APT) family kinase protein
LATTTLTKYHGDFILDNILVKEGQFVLLDWREMFGDQVVWGDMYYDLAKLRHNIQFTHGNIAAGLFEIHKDADGIEIDMKTNWSLMRQLEEVDRHIVERGWNLQKVKILTALIWLNMAPLYPSPLADFLYGFGKLNLHLALHTPVGIL